MTGGQLFFAAVMALYAFYIVRWLLRKVAPPLRDVSDRARRAKRTFDASISEARAKAVSRLDDLVLSETAGNLFDTDPTDVPGLPDESVMLRAIASRIRTQTR